MVMKCLCLVIFWWPGVSTSFSHPFLLLSLCVLTAPVAPMSESHSPFLAKMVGRISVIAQQVQVAMPIMEFDGWGCCCAEGGWDHPPLVAHWSHHIIQVYPGKDGFVRVAAVKTVKGVYKRLASKITLLLPEKWTLLMCLVIVTLTVYLYHSFLKPSGLGRQYVGSYMIITWSYNHCNDCIVYNL